MCTFLLLVFTRMIQRSARLRGLFLASVVTASGCSELRGRHEAREGNKLYRDGRYADALALYEQAQRRIPGLWLLWLNKGVTCRQLMIPGAHTPENERAVTCALEAFQKVRALHPADQRAEGLYVQTLFDADRFETLTAMYQAQLRVNPTDLSAVNGLIQVYTRWNRTEEALYWYQQRASLEPKNAEAQYAVGVFIWNQLFQKGGGAEMAGFDPRPDPNLPVPPVQRKRRKGKRAAAAAAPAPTKVPPAFGPGDITGEARERLADAGIARLQKALVLRPRYREALTFLNLLYRQKSFAYFSTPDKWQAAVDAAERWRREAETLARSP